MVVGALLLATPRLIANTLFEGPTWVEVTLGSVYIWGLLLLVLPVVWQRMMRDRSPVAAAGSAGRR